MKYNMTKKVCYSIIIAAMAIGFTLIAISVSYTHLTLPTNSRV